MLYKVKPQNMNFLNETKKKAKITCTYKLCTHFTYHVKILNSFNPVLQLKNTESQIKSKLKTA